MEYSPSFWISPPSTTNRMSSPLALYPIAVRGAISPPGCWVFLPSLITQGLALISCCGCSSLMSDAFNSPTTKESFRESLVCCEDFVNHYLCYPKERIKIEAVGHRDSITDDIAQAAPVRGIKEIPIRSKTAPMLCGRRINNRLWGGGEQNCGLKPLAVVEVFTAPGQPCQGG